MVKSEDFQPTIESIVAKSPVKDWKRLLVTGQSEISAGQDFDRGCRSTYSECLCVTPLLINNNNNNGRCLFYIMHTSFVIVMIIGTFVFQPFRN